MFVSIIVLGWLSSKETLTFILVLVPVEIIIISFWLYFLQMKLKKKRSKDPLFFQTPTNPGFNKDVSNKMNTFCLSFYYIIHLYTGI